MIGDIVGNLVLRSDVDGELSTGEAKPEPTVVTIDETLTSERLDRYLTTRLPDVSRGGIQRLMREGCILVDGKPAKPTQHPTAGQTVEVTWPMPKELEAKPEDLPLDILFEDDDLVVVNKPAGMVVHPAYANLTGTLVNALLAHCQSLSSVGGGQRPGLVHRLDKDTSGLLVVAKDDVTHVALARQLSDRKIEREYRAIVWGHLRKKSDRIEAPLARHPKERVKMVIHKDGKHAVTHYEVLEELPLTSYLKLNLETGRTHQIRVHLASIGHPVFSDATYGGRGKQLAGLNHDKTRFATQLLKRFNRQMLHARTLAFIHPVSGELMRFETPIPQDMQQLLDLLRQYAV